MVLQDIARLTKIIVWQDRARWSYKILEDWQRLLFGKMEQDGLTRFCKIDQGYLSSKIKQDELSSNIKQDLPRIFFGIF